MGEKFLPHYPLWSPHFTDAKTGIPRTRSFPVGDAGVYDDLGHLPLLRRNVSKMVVFDTSAGYSKKSGGKADIWEMSYLTAAFGQPDAFVGSLAGASNPNMPKDYLTVFDPADFPKLWAEITRLSEAREPIIIRGNYTTVRNDHFGVAGGRLYRRTFPITNAGKQFPSIRSVSCRNLVRG